EKLAYAQVGATLPQGKMRRSLPRAWYSHSASVSRRRAPVECTVPSPLHWQKACACAQVMQVTGNCSCAPGLVVVVQLGASSTSPAAAHLPAVAQARNAPTVTSVVSTQNDLVKVTRCCGRSSRSPVLSASGSVPSVVVPAIISTWSFGHLPHTALPM